MRLFKLIGLIIALSGCATVVRLPNSTGQIPEARGGFLKGHMGLDVVSTTSVTIINDITTSPATRSQIGVGQDQNVIGEAVGFDLLAGTRIDFSLGLLKKLDVYFNQAIGLRYQFLGDAFNKGWKASAFVGRYNSEQTSSLGSETSTFYEGSTNISGTEFGVSIGNRVSKKVLYYTTLASRGGKADINVLVNHSKTEEYRDKFDHYILSLGLIAGSRWFFRAEVSGSQIKWRGEDANGNGIGGRGTEGGFNLGIGYRWGASSTPGKDPQAKKNEETKKLGINEQTKTEENKQKSKD